MEEENGSRSQKATRTTLRKRRPGVYENFAAGPRASVPASGSTAVQVWRVSKKSLLIGTAKAWSWAVCAVASIWMLNVVVPASTAAPTLKVIMIVGLGTLTLVALMEHGRGCPLAPFFADRTIVTDYRGIQIQRSHGAASAQWDETVGMGMLDLPGHVPYTIRLHLGSGEVLNVGFFSNNRRERAALWATIVREARLFQKQSWWFEPGFKLLARNDWTAWFSWRRGFQMVMSDQN